MPTPAQHKLASVRGTRCRSLRRAQRAARLVLAARLVHYAAGLTSAPPPPINRPAQAQPGALLLNGAAGVRV